MNMKAKFHSILQNIAARLSDGDVERLCSLCSSLCTETKCDAYSLLLCLESAGAIDETNLRELKYLLQAINRHDLLVYLSIMQQLSGSFIADDSVTVEKRHLSNSESSRSSRKRKQSQSKSSAKYRKLPSDYQESQAEDEKKTTDDCCELRIRVRAVYNDHSAALQTVQSSRDEAIERAFDRFSQASGILRSRDLGTVVCEAKFAELHFLDAFWRDYRTGTLLETLKNVFLTESLRQSAGTDGVRILVHVDEDEYLSARRKLLEIVHAAYGCA